MWADSYWDIWLAEFAGFFPRLALGFGIFIAFWIVASVGSTFVYRLGQKRNVDPNLISLFGSSVKIALLLFGGVTALGTLHIDVSALVAGLGLTGFAIGFALKDIISNAVSGILLILYKPFHHGDQITVTGFEGTVVEVNMRYTVLNAADQKRIYLPNSNLFTNPVTVHPRSS